MVILFNKDANVGWKYLQQNVMMNEVKKEEDELTPVGENLQVSRLLPRSVPKVRPAKKHPNQKRFFILLS